MRTRSSRPAPATAESGFTLIELVVAMALAAFAFTAAASVLFSATKVLSVQKSRTQGNDLATIAIEDLQRLSYSRLGLCAAPSGAAPPGLADTVFLSNCSGSPAPVAYGPCQTTAPPANAYPDEEYQCTRRGIEYLVKRYVAFGDVAHTVKRLAVFVEWRDRGGQHRVSQQSSLRIPTQTAGVGNPPPVVSSIVPSTTSVSLDAGGLTTQLLTVTAEVTGLSGTSNDAVVAVFETIGATDRQQVSINLALNAGTTWIGTLPLGSGPFGDGKQFVVVTALRGTDGKVNSKVGPMLTLTHPAPAGAAPSMTATGPASSAIDIDANGDLTGPVSFEVTTVNISPAGSVRMTFETETGAVTVTLQPTSTASAVCDLVGTCSITWKVTLSPTDGYHFQPGSRSFHFTALQPPTSAYPVDAGRTMATTAGPYTFS